MPTNIPPDTRYARSGDYHIAYQVLGTGPADLVFVPGFISNIDHYWDDPILADFLGRLASFSRLILFDKRGTGLSDRVDSLPTLEERMDDVRAVMDAVESREAALFGISEGGAMAMLFAATYPERVRALALVGAYAHHPTWVTPEDALPAALARVEKLWGSGELVRAFAPSRADDPQFKRWWARLERSGASPKAALDIMRMNNGIDVRHLLPTIRVPTLVLHAANDVRVDVAAGRFLASAINGARYVELPGRDHPPFATEALAVAIADHLEEFLTGSRSAAEVDRVLATVLFTDIVASTERASALGDKAWRSLLERHDALARREIARFRGRVIKSTGDGFLATFDGPARAVRCAGAIASGVRELGLAIRGGAHTGEIDVRDETGDIGGIAVHIASRIAALAGSGEILVSSTVKDLVAGSNLRFESRGIHILKGLPEGIQLFAATAV